MTIPLARLARCFEAVIPSVLTTASRDGQPNIINVSHVHLVDDRHVAISRQFFRKTRANLDENPHACAAVMDPANMDTYRLRLRFEREEQAGPVFDAMATRLEAVASMTGMRDVFRLQSVMIFEVLAVEPIPEVIAGPGHAVPEPARAGMDALSQLRVLRRVGDCLREASDAETFLTDILARLDEALGFDHAMILLLDEARTRLYAVASRGYPESGVGAEVLLGEGVIGTVAQRRHLLRVADVSRALRYGRAIRSSVPERAGAEVPLPGLPDAQSQLAIPLLVKDELLGVLAVESREPLAYTERDEEFLGVAAGQVALGLHALLRAADGAPTEPPRAAPTAAPAPPGPPRRFLFYRSDDCVFVDDQYLVRNLPGRILWKLLRAHEAGRTEFTNRELRLDGTLGLPELRDNLESRLILLRKRLAEKCPDVAMRPTGRGRFTVEIRRAIELREQP